MRTSILLLSLISTLVLSTAAHANGEATQCILTIEKVEFKNTLGEWKTAYEGHLPLDIAAPDASDAAANGSVPVAREERVRLAAYRHFMMRGGAGGDEVADWLEAEAEVAREDAAQRASTT